MVPAEQDYLDGLRALTTELGALLIMDEVITFRLTPSGMQALYITPDLTTIGRSSAGAGGRRVRRSRGRDGGVRSQPGRRDPPLRDVQRQPGDDGGRLANMELLTPAEHDRINALGDRLRDGINALGADLGLTVSATGVGSLLNIHLRELPIRTHRDVLESKEGGSRCTSRCSTRASSRPAAGSCRRRRRWTNRPWRRCSSGRGARCSPCTPSVRCPCFRRSETRTRRSPSGGLRCAFPVGDAGSVDGPHAGRALSHRRVSGRSSAPV